MTTTINSAMKENGRNAWKSAAFVLSVIVYLAGLLYAGVRSYSLFARTVPADLLPLAILGIVALELTALGLPLALHFWTAPGPQRYAAYGLYGLDLVLIVANAILDAGHQAGTILPDFMNAYGIYGVPALPVVCMVGWAVIWALDPASKESDMRMAVRAATQAALAGKIIEKTNELDITEMVDEAAGASARALVGETLGTAPRRPALPLGQSMIGGHGYNADVAGGPEGISVDIPEPVRIPAPARNGTRKGAAVDGPKAGQ